MKVWTSRMLAVSLAGHDKGAIFVVLEEPSAGVSNVSASVGQPKMTAPCNGSRSVYHLLADGKTRTLEHPKKKKARHVQEITHLPEELLSQMEEITLDAHVRKIIKEYQKYQSR